MTEIARSTIKYASTAILIALTIARFTSFVTGQPENVNELVYILLIAGTALALIFLRFNQVQIAAWAFFIGALAGMFNNSLTGTVGQALAITGYVIALVLAIMILPNQQWLLVMFISAFAISLSTFVLYFSPWQHWTSEAHLSFGVMQLCYLFVAAITVGYLYSRVLRLFDQIKAANVELEALEEERSKQAQAASESNERMRMITDNLPVRIVYFDKNEQITFSNKAFGRYFNATQDQQITVADALKENYAFCKPYIDQALGGEQAEFEMQHHGKASGQFAQTTYVPHVINNKVEGVIVLAVDTTERHHMDVALREKTDLLEIITNNLPARISYTDKNGTIKFINQAFAQKYGLSSKQVPFEKSIMETSVGRLMKVRQENAEIEQRVLAGENLSFEWEEEISGTLRTSQINIVPHIVDGEVIGYSSLALDTTEQKEAARALREKTELLEIITQNAPVRISYYDQDHNMLFHNKAFIDGYRHMLKPEFRDATDLTRFVDYVTSEPSREKRFEKIKEVNQGKVVRFEITDEKGDGDYEIMQYVYAPHIEDGKTVGRVALGIDITELRETQKTLEGNLAMFDHVINNVPARIGYIDADNILVFVNDRIETDFGFKVEDVIGRNAKDVFPAAYYDQITPYVQQAVATKQKVVFDEPVTLPCGKAIIERTYLYPQYVKNRFDAMFMLHMDVTDAKRTEDSLNKSQKLESLGVLAGGIAHDFNNLLVAMLGQSSLALAKIGDDHPARRHIAQSVAASERAASLTQQMLAYSGRGSFAIGAIDLNDVISKNLKLFEVSIPKNVQLVTRLADKLPVIEADIAQIQQIIMNLIINAGQAIGEDNGRITILTGVEKITPDHGEFWGITGDELVPGAYVSVQVQDDGKGMDEETQNKIFDPFYTTKESGTGLGLAAVLGIIRGHRGGIRVYSEQGHGTVFHILFPIAQTEIAAQVTAVLGSAETTTHNHTILVIDDEVGVVNAVSDMLEMKGIVTIQATRGKDALRIYNQRKDEISLVLLDLMMPGMNGEEVFKALREINPNVSVILSSGYSEAEATRRFIGQKLADFIQKPYDFQTLVNKVLEVLEPEPA